VLHYLFVFLCLSYSDCVKNQSGLYKACIPPAL
jgi:hypothetical protein